MNTSTYAKAIAGGLASGLAAASAAALDGHISLAETFVIAGAMLAGFNAVYWKANTK